MLTRFIPNLFTLGNLFLGMLAILLAINEKYSLAAILVIIAMLLDGLDGRVARALNAQSEFGKELDSLSDMVSFGAAPALIIFMVSFQDATPIFAWIATAAFPICGAIRLARFNVRPGIPGYFTGLPIPAAGGVLATLSLFHKDIGPISMMIATLLLSYLMVSSLKYPNFKKVGLPRKAIWIAPWVILLAVGLALLFPDQLSKLIFIPLVLYALYGMKHSVRIAASRNRAKKRKGEKSSRSDS
ncbi:CDP-diacylglycerol--serine O-phosphatidyltransferase [Paenibacillus silvae]|uniref:CDP-diacylglycerol--serine O-phosphatidyltransferase n=1 Tax=Paenibacillus silvae TaxID=1325358 RepID=A0ABQ1ZQT1_9BACL|nr:MULTISPECIES: CDP-diacylglycerol--serine O-phosphatidyltransferase [Paenibacillus]MCK6078798.1 CDP-diacylglycerol--serine O-phosphatidyltransferase [Paenibacillus silvae]MCK6153117.1 CDP-diacylglycerol--serine O-phosphatidyltransferase [Paenibacillus silvae]MCK6271627.1 CDP-diacylglycerol--serine O-phosphatidyltransferase [Paenibacillus silvae]GGH71850.1 CDP-diacylglycerol--serine O-phosphatidyltransferase [Paenibacillus silvae]